MQAEIYINRKIVAANKRLTKETGKLIDLPAIERRGLRAIGTLLNFTSHQDFIKPLIELV